MIVTCENEAGPAGAPTPIRALTRLIDYTDRGLAVKATRVCAVPSCERPYLARGYCRAHYDRWATSGDPGPAVIAPRRPAGRPCAAAGCDKGGKIRRDYCEMHYRRWRLYGDANTVLMPMGTGDEITNTAAHERVRRLRGPAREHACLHCGGPAAHWAYDHRDANERSSPRGPYSPDPEHYMPLCVPCHKRFDLNRIGRVT